MEETDAKGDLESVLIADAATASVIMRRTFHVEAARVARRIADRRNRLAPMLLRKLEEADSSVEFWDESASEFARTRRLSADRFLQMLTQFGGTFEDLVEGKNPEVQQIQTLGARLDGALTADAREAVAREIDAWHLGHRDAAEAEVERLRQKLARLEDDNEAWFDPSPAAERLRRYRADAERLLHRSLARLNTLRRLPDLGVDFIDTADSYGPNFSEELLREALAPYGKIHVATKGGLARTGPNIWIPVGRPEYLIQQAHTSRWRLGVESRGTEPDSALIAAAEKTMREGEIGPDLFFFRHRGGREASGALAEALAGYQAVADDHPYWSGGAPEAMLIDEVEAIWSAIAERDDWQPLADKVAAVRRMGEALGEAPAPAGVAA